MEKIKVIYHNVGFVEIYINKLRLILKEEEFVKSVRRSGGLRSNLSQHAVTQNKVLHSQDTKAGHHAKPHS